MFKKALIAAAVLAATSGVGLANGGSFAPAPMPTHVCAFYVGAGVSRDSAVFDTDGVAIDTAGNIQGNSIDWHASGIDGQLYAGLQGVYQDHYTLAAEIFGDISSLKGDLDNSFNFGGFGTVVNHANIEVDHTVGIALLPGFKLSDSTSLYGRVGWVYSRFKLNDSGVANVDGGIVNSGVTQALGYLTGYPLSRSDNESGLQLGLGLQAMVTNNVGVRGEYDWERYSKVNVTRGGFAATPTGTIVDGEIVPAVATAKISARPTINKFILSLNYYFMS